MNKRIAITTGDVNGIGAEITIKALNKLNLPKENVLIISNQDILNYYGKLKNNYDVLKIDFDKKEIKPGEITSESGDFSFRGLAKACELAKSGDIEAIVTAPVSKEAMHLAGYNFNGQTEVLQSFLSTDNQKAEMLFIAENFRVMLLTRHVALKDVNITKEDLISKISALNVFFKSRLGLSSPKLALCALNPHAGENGIIGQEEIEILQPAVDELKRNGINITKPLPADTLFINGVQAYLNGENMPYDCYISCYHDQGLIPIKSVASDKTVNMTIGLNVIRTSPCHGTAFDIAGKNIADESSMIEAIRQILKI